jgi:hypothetical protein
VGHNPKSGEKVDVPAKKVPFFKTGKELRGIVANNSFLKLDIFPIKTKEGSCLDRFESSG